MSDPRQEVPTTPQELPESQQALNLYANKCAELGDLERLMKKSKDDYELRKHNILVDLDKLAEDHNKKLQKEQKSKAQEEVNQKLKAVASENK